MRVPGHSDRDGERNSPASTLFQSAVPHKLRHQLRTLLCQRTELPEGAGVVVLPSTTETSRHDAGYRLDFTLRMEGSKLILHPSPPSPGDLDTHFQNHQLYKTHSIHPTERI